jgi:hypothetical protein
LTLMTTAADAYALKLRRGRFLSGWPLAAACSARNLLMSAPFVFLGDSFEGTEDIVAPSWVIVTDRRTGRRIARVAAGRDSGAGQALYDDMAAALNTMPPDDFLGLYASRAGRL